MPDVAAVVGSYAGEAHLPECLRSLRAQSVPPAELVVVDASSGDRSGEIAEREGARFLVVRNRGLGFLYNRGVEAVSAPFVLLSNVDVSYDERCLELLADALEANDRAFAADACQLGWDGTTLVHGYTTLRRGRMLREYFPGLHLDHRAAASSVVPTVAAHGAAMLVRRDRFLELGGFDERFFLDWEDLDLCWRAWLRGWPTVYVPDARLRHRVGAVTSAEIAPRRRASSHHNILRFALKCLPPAAAARVVAGELLRWPRHFRAIGRAFVGVAVELPEILRLRRAIHPTRSLFDAMLAGDL
ncbi:MAG TPA: glycosyltransferase family 2 protein [Gaiellaceae bacterium]